MKKAKTVTLAYPFRLEEGDYRWKVEKVGNSVDVTPGDLLSKAQVEDLCAARDWTVVIVANKDGVR